MIKKSYSQPKEKSRIIEIDRKKIIILASIIFIIISVSIYFGAKFATKYIYNAKIVNVRSNNKSLLSSVKRAKNKLSNIDSNVDNLVEKDKALRTYINLRSINQDINEIGVGGKILHKSRSMDDLLPGDSIEISSLMNDIDQLEKRIKLEQLSYKEINNSFEEYSNKIESTPSIRPVNQAAYVSDDFGYRNDPITGEKRFHYGIDYAAPRGTSVLATADGIVRNTRRSPSFGKIVLIDHGFGFTTIYAHLYKSFVDEGEKISRGEKIAEIGNTGRTTGPHLHYGIRKYNMKRNPLKYYFTGQIRIK